MKTKLRQAVYLIGIGYLALTAQAGVVIQQEGGEMGSPNKRQKVTLYLDAGKIRLEGENPDGKKFIMIFDQDKQVVWNINLDDHSYMEMTQAQVEGMAQQMGDVMKQMQDRMAQMPPEQRKMMEDMMKQRMGGMSGGAAAAPTITVQEKGSGEKVGPYTTTHYEILTNGQRSSEVWAAPRNSIHLEEADFNTFKAMAKFYEPLSRNAPKGSFSMSAMQQIQGFPVRTVSYDGQRPAFEWTVINAEQRSLEGSLFTLPPGLKKNEMMGPRGMGRPPQR